MCRGSGCVVEIVISPSLPEKMPFLSDLVRISWYSPVSSGIDRGGSVGVIGITVMGRVERPNDVYFPVSEHLWRTFTAM